MTQYLYQAKDSNGIVSKGRIRADSVLEVRQRLKEKNKKTLEILEVKENFANKEISIGKKNIKPKVIVKYLQQLSSLVNAGISVLEAHKMMQDDTEDNRLKEELNSICAMLEEGQSLSKSLEKNKGAFPSMMISVIHAAEISGSLDSSLLNLASYFEKKNKSRQKIISALIYPAVLMLVAIGVAIFLMVSVVPMFVELFKGFNAELPKITQITMFISDVLVHKSWFLLLLIIGVILLFKVMMKQSEFKYKIHYYILKAPIFGQLIQKNNLSSIFSTMSNLLASSVMISTSLDLSTEVVDNVVMKELLFRTKKEIEQGNPLSKSFEESDFVPKVTTQMIKTGESTGNLESMLVKLSEIYEEEVDLTAERLKTLLEPLIIIFVAVIVGLILAAIMIPMFSIYDVIQG